MTEVSFFLLLLLTLTPLTSADYVGRYEVTKPAEGSLSDHNWVLFKTTDGPDKPIFLLTANLMCSGETLVPVGNSFGETVDKWPARYPKISQKLEEIAEEVKKKHGRYPFIGLQEFPKTKTAKASEFVAQLNKKFVQKGWALIFGADKDGNSDLYPQMAWLVPPGSGTWKPMSVTGLGDVDSYVDTGAQAGKSRFDLIVGEKTALMNIHPGPHKIPPGSPPVVDPVLEVLESAVYFLKVCGLHKQDVEWGEATR